MATQQLGFYVNQQFCVGCKTCQIACKEKNDSELGVIFRRVYEVEGGGYAHLEQNTFGQNVFAYYVTVACNHCDEPKCVQNCPTGAMSKNPEDGVVSVDKEKCIGCRYCVWSCPYAGPQYNEKLGKVQKCDLCADYRKEGRNPACVDSCLMRAIEWGPVEELKKKHPEAVTELKGMPDQSLTKPNTIYTPHRTAHPKAAAGAEGR